MTPTTFGSQEEKLGIFPERFSHLQATETFRKSQKLTVSHQHFQIWHFIIIAYGEANRREMHAAGSVRVGVSGRSIRQRATARRLTLENIELLRIPSNVDVLYRFL